MACKEVEHQSPRKADQAVTGVSTTDSSTCTVLSSLFWPDHQQNLRILSEASQEQVLVHNEGFTPQAQRALS